MGRANSNGIECLNKLDEVRVYAYNGVASDNFQVYHSNSAVLPRPPGSCSPATRAGFSNAVTCPIAAQGPVAPTATFSVAPTSIASGQTATLSWSTTNATTVTINQGVGTVAASGTRSVSPTATTTYTLTATNSAGSVTATATVTLAGTRITPTITWSTPASIVYGTALSGTQLNAATTVPGSWTYVPAAGTILAAGAGQTLSVTFTPTDTARYNSASATVAITVLKATPLITWPTPAAISCRDAARRDAVERDGDRGRDVRVHAAERDGPRRGRRPDALRGLHADRHRQLQHGEQDRAAYRDRHADDRAQRGARQCLR